MTTRSIRARWVRGGVLAVAMLFASVASAEVTLHLQVPFNTLLTDPCLGELVELSGTIHVLASATETGNGLRLMSHSNPQGVSGTGLTSGAGYRAVGVTTTTTFQAPDSLDLMFVNVFAIIGKGPASNSTLHQNVHVTMNALGEITASVDNIHVSCR